MSLYFANLAFLANYTDGTKQDEIEYEIYKVAFQLQGSVHYDRANGGSFQELEQEQNNGDATVLMLRFSKNLIEAIYRVNEEKKFNPYIVVGFSDITQYIDKGEYTVQVSYRLLQDLSKQGSVNIEL